MSFSSDVKEELSRVAEQERSCQIAELSAIIGLCGNIELDAVAGRSIKIFTENVAVARRFYILIKESFGISPQVLVRRHEYLRKNRYYMILVRDSRAGNILKKTGLMNNLGNMDEGCYVRDNPVIKNTSCMRAFLRGAFLSAGSMTDPEKNYHFEIVCSSFDKALQIRELYEYFDLEARIVPRKKYYVLYMKEGSMIADALNIMGAHQCLMRFENIRILKDVRNSVNRRVNCEAANISKTVSAAQKQIEDIKYIKDTVGLDRLNDNLKDVALARLNEPEISLKELGSRLKKPVGKSGVNHRLRKLSQIAQNIRETGKL